VAGHILSGDGVQVAGVLQLRDVGFGIQCQRGNAQRSPPHTETKRPEGTEAGSRLRATPATLGCDLDAAGVQGILPSGQMAVTIVRKIARRNVKQTATDFSES